MLGLLSVAAGFLYVPLGKAAALVPEVLSAYILRAAHLLSRIPGHALYYTNPYLKYWLVYANLLFITAYFSNPGPAGSMPRRRFWPLGCWRLQ